jgi:transcriptional regulator with XRE-family HTH domain
MVARKPTGRQPANEQPMTKSHSSADDALRWIAEGIDLPDGDAREEEWFESLRRQLRALRKERGLSQTVVAERLERPQSEVSRLENSLGPGSRIGAIRDYVKACDAQSELKVSVSKAAEEASFEPAVQHAAYEGRHEAAMRRLGFVGHVEDIGVPAEVYECRVSPWLDSHRQAGSSPIGLMLEGHMFVGVEAVLMRTVLKALVQVLAEAGVQPDRSGDLIRKTLTTMDEQRASVE